MPPNLLNTFGEENPDLSRQLGCVAGIFQAFSRHRIHSSRRLTGVPHRTHPPGAPPPTVAHLEEHRGGISSEIDREEESTILGKSSNGIGNGAGSSSSSSCSSPFSEISSARAQIRTVAAEPSAQMKEARWRSSAGRGLPDSVTAAGDGFLVKLPRPSPPAKLQNGRPAGVVAKLMGLDAMPSMPRNQDRPPLTSPEKRKEDLRRAAPARLPLETAPWKERTRRSRHVSVYCELQTKLRDLDLGQSNRDFRALKHILESMQTKMAAPPSPPPPEEHTGDSSIVIVKPAGSSDASGIPLGGLSGIKVLMDGGRVGGGAASRDRDRSREAVSQRLCDGKKQTPRLQQKIVDHEKKPRPPPTSSPGSGKPLRKSTSQPPVKIRQSAERVRRQSVNQPSAISRESRRRAEVNAELGSAFSRRGDRGAPNPERKKPLQCLGEDLSAESTATSLDQPSPVSVLDASFHGDDQLSSPVCKNPHPFKADEHDLSTSGSSGLIITASIQKKIESIENLLQKLSKLGCDGGGDHIASLCEKQTPDNRYVSEVLLASGLLMDLGGAAGAVHLSSGFPVNPDLFLVLEQTRSGGGFPDARERRNPNPERTRRRLLFDAINEVLLRKMEAPAPRIIRRIVAVVEPPGRKLLREICSEIDGLQPNSGVCDDAGIEPVLREEASRQWRWWLAAGEEFAGVVLDIERSIFKNLVDEVVAGESIFYPGGRLTRGRRRRRLFPH